MKNKLSSCAQPCQSGSLKLIDRLSRNALFVTFIFLASFLWSTTAVANEKCGFLDPKINFADGSKGCLRADTPFFNRRGLIANDNRTYRDVARSHRTYTFAVTQDQNSCPFVSGVAWDWHFAENTQRAISTCESKFPPQFSRSCKCEVILDYWDSPLGRDAFYAKLSLLENQIVAGGSPLGASVASRPSTAVPAAKPPSPAVKAPEANRPPVTPAAVSPAQPDLKISVAASVPAENGEVVISITSNRDLDSLRIDDVNEGPQKSGQSRFVRFASIGTTIFEINVRDRNGNSQSQSVAVTRSFSEPSLRVERLNPLRIQSVQQTDAVAIVIGIEKYRRVADADFANKDAATFVDYAVRALGVKPENIRLILDEKADAAEILRAFKSWLPTRVSKGQTDVYIFYSGHGLPSQDGNTLYFLPHEVDKDFLERTALTYQEIISSVDGLAPRTATIFIDSCYSGHSRTGETLLASARPINIRANETTLFPPNFTVISASAPDQISSSSPALRHGIFSYYLMRGMEGEADANKDGRITVAEMQSYLAEQVPRRASGMNRTQQPQVFGDLNRVLVSR